MKAVQGGKRPCLEVIDVRQLVGAPGFSILVSAVLGAPIITFLVPTLDPHLLVSLGYGPGISGAALRPCTPRVRPSPGARA